MQHAPKKDGRFFQQMYDNKDASQTELKHKPLQEFANVISILAAYRKESKVPPPPEIITIMRAVVTAPGEEGIKKYIANWQEMLCREIFTLADEVNAGVVDSSAPLLTRLAFIAEFSAALHHDKAKEIVLLICDTLSSANGNLGEKSVAALVKFYPHIPGDQFELKKKIVDRLLQICSTHEDYRVKHAALQSLHQLRPILNSDGFYKDIEPVMLAVVVLEKDPQLIELALSPLRHKAAEIPDPEMEKLVKNLCNHVKAGVMDISVLDRFCQYIKKPAVIEEIINIALKQLDVDGIPERKIQISDADAKAHVDKIRGSLSIFQFIDPEIVKNLHPFLIKKIIDALFKKLNDHDRATNEFAMIALGKFHSLIKDHFQSAESLFKKELDRLCTLINNKYRDVQQASISCVGNLCAAGILPKDRMKSDIMKLCASNSDLHTRMIALQALEQIDSEAAKVQIKAFNDEIMQKSKTIQTAYAIHRISGWPEFQSIIYDRESLLNEMVNTFLNTIKEGAVAKDIDNAINCLTHEEYRPYLPAILDEETVQQILDQCTIPSKDAEASADARKRAYKFVDTLPPEILKQLKGEALQKFVFNVIHENDNDARTVANSVLKKIFFESNAKDSFYTLIEAHLQEPQLTEVERLRGIALLAELRQEAYVQQQTESSLIEHFPADVARIMSGQAKS